MRRLPVPDVVAPDMITVLIMELTHRSETGVDSVLVFGMDRVAGEDALKRRDRASRRPTACSVGEFRDQLIEPLSIGHDPLGKVQLPRKEFGAIRCVNDDPICR